MAKSTKHDQGTSKQVQRKRNTIPNQTCHWVRDDPREFAIKKFKPDREGDTHHYVGISQSACREIAVGWICQFMALMQYTHPLSCI